MSRARELAQDVSNYCHMRHYYVEDKMKYGLNEHHMTIDEIRAEIAANGFLKSDCEEFGTLAMFTAIDMGMVAQCLTCGLHRPQDHMVCIIDDEWIVDCNDRRVWHVKEMPYSLEDSQIGYGNHWRKFDGFNENA